MAKRKYAYYSVATEYGESEFFCYREALSYYRSAGSATLYGTDEYGEISVILSK